MIPEVGGPVDVVITICSAKCADADYNELRFVLRSFAQNFAQLGRVFIVGETPPAWLNLDKVIHLPVMDHETWKDFNLFNKLRIACHSGVSRHFLFCSDDQFLLLPSVPADFWPRSEGELTTWSEELWKEKIARQGKWYQRLKRTVEVVRRGRSRVYNFDSHHPVLMDSELFLDVVRRFGLQRQDVVGENGYTINSLYFNAIGAEPHPGQDLFRPKSGLPQPTIRFWNVNEQESWPKALPFLRKKFPEPSPFERAPLAPGPAGPEAVTEPAPALAPRPVQVEIRLLHTPGGTQKFRLAPPSGDP